MKLVRAALVVLILSVSSPHPAFAQVIEEIVVTATKRGAATVQDVPLSVQAISGDNLEEIGALNFNDYFRQVPGLDVADNGPGDKRYIVRGVNSVGAGTVGLYFDEIIITGENAQDGGGRQPDIKLFDMDRIEVLRGPQGSTFGSSSMTGTIRLIPRAPDLEEFSASGGVGLTDTRFSDGVGWKFDGALNLPVIEDRLAVRVSGLKVDQKGYIDNRFDEDGNNDDSEAIRAIVLWTPTDELEISFLAMHQEQVSEGRPFFTVVDNNIPTNPNFNGVSLPDNFNTALSRLIFEDEIDMFNLKLNYSRDWGTFTATSSLFERDTVFDRDASAALELFSGGFFVADGSGQSIITQPKEREMQSHEIRFASDWDSKFQILVGGFVQNEERFFQSRIFGVDPVTGLIPANPSGFLDRNVDTEIDETAFFSELSYDFTDRLTATLGLRWFDFEIEELATAVATITGAPGPGPGPLLSSSEDGVTLKGNVSYHLTDDAMAYVQVAEGFRSGGTNDQTAASLANVTIPEGFESDSLVNYELGLKTSWMDKRFVANGALYYIDWSDIQVQQQARAPDGTQFPFRGNGGSAEVYGFEIELNAYPSENFEFGVGLNLVQAELSEDLPVPTDGLNGDDIPYVPNVSGSIRARYERPIGAAELIGFIGGDWSYTDEQTTEFRPTNTARFREIDSYSIMNLRVGVKGSDWSAILAVNNVFDEDETSSYAFDFVGPPGTTPEGRIKPWPRTVSLTVRKSFAF